MNAMRWRKVLTFLSITLIIAAAGTYAFIHFLILHVMEWGVIVDVGKGNQYKTFVIDPKGRGENPMPDYERDSIVYVDRCCSVREPVQYFYSNIPMNMTVQVTFHGGRPAQTYPRLRTYGVNPIEWNIHLSPKSTSRTIRVPEQFDRMQNRDASTIIANGDTSTFLFYEGLTPFGFPLNIETNKGHDSVRVYNPNSFTATDVCVSTKPDRFSATMRICVDSIGAHQSVSGNGNTQMDLITRLRRDGYSESEARAFDYYWNEQMSKTYNRPFLVYSYLIPQAEMDKIVSVHFSYPFVKFTRKIFYYHFDFEKVPVCRSFSHSLNWMRGL